MAYMYQHMYERREKNSTLGKMIHLGERGDQVIYIEGIL